VRVILYWYFLTVYRATLILCIDNSENVGHDNWQLILKFVQHIIKLSDIGHNRTHVGIVDYGMSRAHVSIFPQFKFFDTFVCKPEMLLVYEE